ncbi:MAG: transcription antitermination factor NusB [Defluviicoccus sp.]|nr:transcription antitermination factor NusB [Defluviicoccus sp.]MDE0383144.1 transcription antitermination factor NusB [Defluviicoccus sp.]
MSEPRAGADRPRPNPAAPLSAARLAAVQALYQMEIAGAPLEEVLSQFLEFHRGGVLDEDQTPVRPKSALFAQILRGTTLRRGEIDDILGAALSPSWPLGRIEVLLACIMRAGVFELLARPEVPARVVITEYVDIADAFFAAAQKGMANAVLDAAAQRLRGGEFGESGGAAGERAAASR